MSDSSNITPITPVVPESDQGDIFSRIVSIIEEARSTVIRTVNSEMMIAYWCIGREIVEEQQAGRERAIYGDNLLKKLSEKLTLKFGKGFSVTSLKYFRTCYVTYKGRISCDQSEGIQQKVALSATFSPNLSWSHYRVLMRISNELRRTFYEIEADKCRWNVNELERQIASSLFERIAKGKNKEQILRLACEGQKVLTPTDAIRDPMVLEFLNLPESHKLIESDLEEALISHLQEFLLEMGQGFAFVGRQQRLSLDGDHFYADLVFYHVLLKCYVVVDLKTEKLSHADLGQMQLYINYYDREIKDAIDNPTLGLVLCTDKNEAMVQYLLGEDNQQIFATRYKLFLPDVKELETELLREVRLLTTGEEV